MTERITYKKASEMMGDKKSLLFSINRQEHLALHPKYLGNLKSGVLETLNSFMSMYHDRFDGVPLAYSNIKMAHTMATMIAYQPYLHFDITADFIIFKPNIGSSLKGVIQKVEMNHISCLVHGTFNAWCPKQPLIKALKDPDPLVLMGCEIEFTVKKVSSNNGVLSMRGDFTKVLKRKSPAIKATNTSTPLNKKHAFSDNDDDDDEVDEVNEGNNQEKPPNTPGFDQSFCPELTSTQIETPYVTSVKKRKRKLSTLFESDASLDTSSKDISEGDSYTKLKKKKHKHDKEDSPKLPEKDNSESEVSINHKKEKVIKHEHEKKKGKKDKKDRKEKERKDKRLKEMKRKL